MENPITTQLQALEVLAQIRLNRIRELKEQIKSIRELPYGELQRRLDALLAAPLGDYPLNGEPRNENQI